MLNITRQFVKQWAGEYDESFKWSVELQVETEIRQWLDELSEPKYLNKKYFVKLGWWKACRQMGEF